MRTLLDTKRAHEHACESAIRRQRWQEAKRSAARVAETAFALAEQTSADVSRRHLEDGEEWLGIAEQLATRSSTPTDGKKNGDAKAAPQASDGENEDADEWLVQEAPNIRFSDIIGMDELKDRIRRYTLKADNPDEVARWPGARKGDGMILYGPPGTGKTYFAKAVATESNAAFFDVKGSNLLSKWVGESQKNVSRLFDAIGKHERAVLFMDEIDGLLAARGSGSSSVREGVLTEFLAAMDGVRSNMRSLLFIGATNRPVALDRAILSRIGTPVYVGLPDQAARKATLAACFESLPHGCDAIDLEALAEKFERCSMRDIRRFCDCLVDLGICRKLETGEGRVDAALVDRAWADAGPVPMSERELKKYQEIAK